MANITAFTPLTELSDLELTTIALNETGHRRERSWTEIIARSQPAIAGSRSRGADREEFVAAAQALIYEAFEEPVEDIVKFARQAISESNIRRELAADTVRRGMTGIGQRRALAARRLAWDADLFGDSLAYVREQEGDPSPDSDGLNIAHARDIDRLSSPASIDELTTTRDGHAFERVMLPLIPVDPTQSDERSDAEQRVLTAYLELDNVEGMLVSLRYGLDGADPVDSTEELATVTGLAPREVKTRLQRARRALSRAA